MDGLPLPTLAEDVVHGPTRSVIAMDDDRIVVMKPATGRISFVSDASGGGQRLLAINRRFLAIGHGGADLVFVPPD